MKNSKKFITWLKSHLNPRNYKWGILGMMIFFVGSVVAWVLTRVEVLPYDDGSVNVICDPEFFWLPGNIFNDS